MRLEEFIGDPYVDLGEMQEKFKHKANESGLPFTGSRMIYNTRRAQELRVWAHQEHGAGEAFGKAVFAAYFVDDKNLARTDVLVGIVRALGLPEDEAREVLSTRRYRQHVESDLRKAQELKIMSPPSFLANGNRLVGTQPFDVLLDFAQGKK